MYLFDRRYVSLEHDDPESALSEFVREAKEEQEMIVGVDKRTTPIVKAIAAQLAPKEDFDQFVKWKARELGFKKALATQGVITLRNRTRSDFATACSFVIDAVEKGINCRVMTSDSRWRVSRAILGPTRKLTFITDDEYLSHKKWCYVKNDPWAWLRVVQAQSGYDDVDPEDTEYTFRKYFARDLMFVYRRAVKEVAWFTDSLDTATWEIVN